MGPSNSGRRDDSGGLRRSPQKVHPDDCEKAANTGTLGVRQRTIRFLYEVMIGGASRWVRSDVAAASGVLGGDSEAVRRVFTQHDAVLFLKPRSLHQRHWLGAHAGKDR